MMRQIVIASLFGIAGTLAACASPADDVVAGPTASVRLTGGASSAHRGEPIAGAGVAFVGPDGVVSLTQTDVAGFATGPAPDGTTVHVVDRESEDSFDSLYSVLDVSGGDLILLGELPSAAYVSYTVRVDFPAPPAGSRLSAMALTRCIEDAFVDSTSVALRLGPGCEDETATLVVTARDETTYEAVGFLVVRRVSLKPGPTITAPSSWQPGSAFTASYTGFPDDAQVSTSVWMRGVYRDGQYIAMAGGAGTGVAMLPDVPMTGVHDVITSVSIPDVRAGSGMIIDPGDGTHAYQLDASARLPAIWGTAYDADTHVFHWSSSEATVPVDAIRIRAGLFVPPRAWQWTVYSPGNRSEVAVPAIPDELLPSDPTERCCGGFAPTVVMIDLEQGTYADVLRIPDVLASFRETPIALIDGNNVAMPRGRWRLTWSGLSP